MASLGCDRNWTINEDKVGPALLAVKDLTNIMHNFCFFWI